MDSALELCQISNGYWEKGDLENALAALDEAYGLILKVSPNQDPNLLQQKEDLRFTISKRIIECYSARFTTTNGFHTEIPVVLNKHVEEALAMFKGQARDFFVAHGLPISDSLMGIVNLYGYQYQDMIRNDPKLQPVKQWVEQYGVSTYLLYLISNPGKTLIEPIRQVPALLDGHVSLYYYPIFPSHPYSNRISDISKIFYFRSPPIEWLAGLLLLGGSLFWIAKSKFNSAWLVMAILTLSIYPMMFIIWHGEPMEIERHAIQIGIQFRLAAWIAFIFLVDAFTIGVLKGQPASANLESKGTL